MQAEYDRLEEVHANTGELPEAVERRLTEIEEQLSALDERPITFDPAEVARAGAFVSIDSAGSVRVERGYVRPEDELPVEPQPEPETDGSADSADAEAACAEPAASMPTRAGPDGGAVHAGTAPASEPEEDDGIKPCPIGCWPS